MEDAAGQFDNANSLEVRLPAAADGQLRNLAEAMSACQHVVESLVYRRNPSGASGAPATAKAVDGGGTLTHWCRPNGSTAGRISRAR